MRIYVLILTCTISWHRTIYNTKKCIQHKYFPLFYCYVSISECSLILNIAYNFELMNSFITWCILGIPSTSDTIQYPSNIKKGLNFLYWHFRSKNRQKNKWLLLIMPIKIVMQKKISCKYIPPVFTTMSSFLFNSHTLLISEYNTPLVKYNAPPISPWVTPNLILAEVCPNSWIRIYWGFFFGGVAPNIFYKLFKNCAVILLHCISLH